MSYAILQVLAPIPTTGQNDCENRKIKLDTGIGTEFGSITVSYPSSVFNQYAKSKKEFFVQKTTKARMALAIEGIRVGSTFQFDYFCLLLTASLLAAVGLASDNAVTIVASMLVSPIMNPVLAVTLGTVIRNKTIAMNGMRVELVSILFCILSGAVIALILVAAGTDTGWLTLQMRSRTTITGLYQGIIVGFVSGIAVAVSVLSNNVSSLVGVAISASLLPPAVNTGMMWMLFIVELFGISHTGDTRRELLAGGWISLILVAINIVVIFLAAILVFYLKDAIPHQDELADWKAATSATIDAESVRNQREKKKSGVLKNSEADISIMPDQLTKDNNRVRNISNGGCRSTADNLLQDTDTIRREAQVELIPPSFPSTTSSASQHVVSTTGSNGLNPASEGKQAGDTSKHHHRNGSAKICIKVDEDTAMV